MTIKYDKHFLQIIMMGNCVTLLAGASIYTQNGYDSFHIVPIFIASFLLTMGYFLYLIFRDSSNLQRFMDQYKIYVKTAPARILGVVCLISLIARFFLPDELIFYIQNGFYIAAVISFIAGTVYLMFHKSGI